LLFLSSESYICWIIDIIKERSTGPFKYLQCKCNSLLHSRSIMNINLDLLPIDLAK